MERKNFLKISAGAIAGLGLPLSGSSSAKSDNIFKYKEIKRTPPSKEEYLNYSKKLNNWFRWGENDELGTLNFITPENVLLAVQLIQKGQNISLGRPLIDGELHMEVYRNTIKWGKEMIGAANDRISASTHGFENSHIDALNHVFGADNKIYNGFSESYVTEDGAKRLGIENMKNGIVTRGVLYDIPKLRNEPYVTMEKPVQGWELEDFAKLKNVAPAKGDATIIHCGRNTYFHENPGAPNTFGNKPGLNPSVLEFLHAYDSALMGSDFDEAPNHDYPATFPLHSIANPYMGLPTMWNFDLQQLSTACERLNRWEFFIVIAPLIVEGATGSIVNPIAIV